jgi:hypothetical protein
MVKTAISPFSFPYPRIFELIFSLFFLNPIAILNTTTAKTIALNADLNQCCLFLNKAMRYLHCSKMNLQIRKQER